jgi:ribonucleoside-diphosphate reductase alpha chain
LGEEKGDFGSIKRSVVTSPQRNATITTIAPTGSISIIAETSSGIEPIFAVVYQKTNILENNTFFEINPIFEEIGKREGWYNQSLVNKVIRNGGRVTGLSEVPDKWQKVFRTALEISPDWHVKMQVAFQKHVNNSISKTINLPYEATVEDVERIIKLAYDLNLKGLTVFRNNSRSQQVLETLCVECEDGSCPIPPATSQSD